MAHSIPERLAILIDGPSLERAAKALKLDIDYKRLLAMFQQRGYLIRAHYYAALSPDRSQSTLRPLLDWLSYNGFSVISRIAKDLTTAGCQGAIAVDLAVDAMMISDRIDHFVLFTGSPDYIPLLAALQGRARRVTIVSTLRAEPLLADDLRRQADYFLELDDLRPIIGREERREERRPMNGPRPEMPESAAN